jgi:hypothetical protein
MQPFRQRLEFLTKNAHLSITYKAFLFAKMILSVGLIQTLAGTYLKIR